MASKQIRKKWAKKRAEQNKYNVRKRAKKQYNLNDKWMYCVCVYFIKCEANKATPTTKTQNRVPVCKRAHLLIVDVLKYFCENGWKRKNKPTGKQQTALVTISKNSFKLKFILGLACYIVTRFLVCFECIYLREFTCASKSRTQQKKQKVELLCIQWSKNNELNSFLTHCHISSQSVYLWSIQNA